MGSQELGQEGMIEVLVIVIGKNDDAQSFFRNKTHVTHHAGSAPRMPIYLAAIVVAYQKSQAIPDDMGGNDSGFLASDGGIDIPGLLQDTEGHHLPSLVATAVQLEEQPVG